MTRIGLVGCASQKLKRPAPARELYVSQLFRKAAAYAEATCDVWYILSAKHGLVRPDTVLEPYNLKVGTAECKTWDWVETHRPAMMAELAQYERVTLVALLGEQYRTIFRPGPWAFSIPMEGLGIGEQLGWLTRELAALEGAAA